MTKTLRPYQAQAADWLIQEPRRILELDMGLGKTLTALTVSELRPRDVLWFNPSPPINDPRCLLSNPSWPPS